MAFQCKEILSSGNTCNKSFEELSSLRRHATVSHPKADRHLTATGEFLCKHGCQNHFLNLSTLQQHLWSQHQGPAIKLNKNLATINYHQFPSEPKADTLFKYRIGRIYYCAHLNNEAKRFYKPMTLAMINKELSRRGIPLFNKSKQRRAGVRICRSVSLECFIAALILLTLSNFGLPLCFAGAPWHLVRRAYTEGASLDASSPLPAYKDHLTEKAKWLEVSYSSRLADI